jgi:hypothetical protein
MKLKEENNCQKKAAADAKKESKEDKDNVHFTQAFQKHIKKLTTMDLKNLLRKVKHCDDSSICSKMVDVKAQWEKRKHRLDAFRTLPGTRTVELPIVQVGEI